MQKTTATMKTSGHKINPITTDVNADLTVAYRQGSSTLTLKGATYINTWLGRSFAP